MLSDHPTRLAAALGLILLTAGCAAPDAPSTAEVEGEVRAFLAHYLEALQSRDEDAIRALYVDDGRFAWFTDGARAYSSADDVLAGLRKYEGIRFETTASEIQVVPLGASRASVRSLFHTTLAIPGAEDYEFDGATTWLLERGEADGEWRVLTGHTSTPGGPPSAGYAAE